MTKLKTLKDVIYHDNMFQEEQNESFREAAREWVKELQSVHLLEHEGNTYGDYDYEPMIISRWIKHFFNLK